MLVPECVERRREFYRKVRGGAKGEREAAFSEYGLQAVDLHWIINRQVEAARTAMTHYMERGGKVRTKVFPHKSYTVEATGVHTDSGKGAPEGRVAPVKCGKIMLGTAGAPKEVAREALHLALHKLSTKTRIVRREETGGESNEG